MRPKTDMHNGEIKDAPEHHCQSRTMIDSEEEKKQEAFTVRARTMIDRGSRA